MLIHNCLQNVSEKEHRKGWLCDFCQTETKKCEAVKAKRIGCCCIKCEKVKLAVQSLNLASMKLDGNINLKLNSEWECSDLTLCDYDNYPQQECMKRHCVDCGTDKLNQHYNNIILINSHGEEEIKISKWKHVKQTKKVRNFEKL